MPSLLYIGQTPAEGTGSPVIVLRHLRRLAASGWKITVIAEHGQDTSACTREGFAVHHLPHRRPWWPPFRHDKPTTRAIRTWLLAREALKLCGPAQRPDALFGYLAAHADFFPEIAARLAKQTGIPLTLLIHDDAAAFGKTPQETAMLHRRHAWILRQAHRNWFVSPELAALYDVPENKRHVLLPIPEGPSLSEPITHHPSPITSACGARVFYAGHIWPLQYPLFARLARTLAAANCRLTLICRESPELRTFLAAEPADHLPLFPTNRAALAHLTQNASGLLVAYAEKSSDMPWVKTSFPSKFIEYAQLGLPIAVVAPADSSINLWAAARNFPYVFTPDLLNRFAQWAAALRDPAQRAALTAPIRLLAATELHPETIQAEFEKHLRN